MFEKLKKLMELPKVFLELSEASLKLSNQQQEQLKALQLVSAKHTEEMRRIEDSIKFRIQDIEQLYPKFLQFMEETQTKIVRANDKLDEIERKVTNMDYKR